MIARAEGKIIPEATVFCIFVKTNRVPLCLYILYLSTNPRTRLFEGVTNKLFSHLKKSDMDMIWFLG